MCFPHRARVYFGDIVDLRLSAILLSKYLLQVRIYLVIFIGHDTHPRIPVKAFAAILSIDPAYEVPQ